MCMVLANAATGKVFKQDGQCEQRLTPASTFKIPLSLMGYDAGYLTDEHHPALPYRESYAASDPSWKTTVDPSGWITQSVVWYSQQLTLWLGKERLQGYVTRFNYGNQDLSGNPGMNDGLTQAWLDSSLQISPLEQIAFLEKTVNRQLGVSTRAYEMTARITEVGKLPHGWDVHGKGGTGFRLKPDHGGADFEHQIGWFVGWATKGTRNVVFAYAIADEGRESTRAGLRAKTDFMVALPQLLDDAPGGAP
jgi:beta-lactamase class D